jgi:hypothetical protein
MSTNAARRPEAWLVLAGMLAAMAWYASPQLAYSLKGLRELAQLALAALGR